MYIANAKVLRWGPNATYILLTRVGGRVGVTQILGLVLGELQILAILDTNMLV